MPDHARNRATGSLVYGATGITRYANPVSCANRADQPVVYYPNTTVRTGEVLTTYDWVTADYYKRRARGDVIINSFFQRRLKLTNPGFSSFRWTSVANFCTGPTIKQWFQYDGQYFAAWISDQIDVPSASGGVLTPQQIQNIRTEVWTSCMAKRQDGNTNLVESVAEMHQAIAMIQTPIQNLRGLIRHLRRSGRRAKGFERVSADGKAFIRFAASEYLRFRFGISPIINDIQAGLKALRKSYDVKPTLQVSRSKGARAARGTASSFFDIAGIARITYKVDRAHTVSVKCAFYDKYTVSPFDDLGITFHNVVVVPWELIRYSFVLDRFINVGDLLYANTPRVGVDAKGGYISMLEDMTTVISPTGYSPLAPGTWTPSGSFNDYLETKETVKRRAPNAGEGTGLVIRDNFKFFDWTRLLDHYSLALNELRSIGFEKNPNNPHLRFTFFK